MPADLHTVRSWLKHLGALTQASIDGREAEVRLQVLTPALAAELPTEAFTPESARAVAGECPKGFPTFGEAVQLLRAWWKQARDPFDLPLLGGPAGQLTDEDCALVRNWQRHAGGDWGSGSGSDRRLRSELGWYRRNRERVFAELVEHDGRARSIAIAAGWLVRLRSVNDNDGGRPAA